MQLLDKVSNIHLLGGSVVILLTYGWIIGFPHWYFIMIAVCAASFGVGWILHWAIDEWKNR